MASYARPSKLPTLVVFPDHILPLQIEPWGKKGRMVKHDDSEFGFATSIYFPEDEEIKEYVLRLFPDHVEELADESPLGIPIGYIYMTVHNDLSTLEHEVPDPNLVMIEFGTTGTRMSLLFSDSRSIRGRFVEFLEKYRGVCDVFNMEMNGQVFWMNGREVDEDISNPWISPKEIEEILMEAHEGNG